MSTVAEHYKNLLAKHYLWMFGLTFEEKVAEQKALLEQTLQSLGVFSNQGLAIDLGSGPGFQSIALAQLGFSPVIAIDTSAELLEELQYHKQNYDIETKQSDIRELGNLIPKEQTRLIVCMGDTLTHLPDKAGITRLFTSAFESLVPGGLFLLTYRDLSNELKGTDRFIPVRSDNEKIMTCFLEYESSETVIVHDIIYTRDGSAWTLHKSSYPKLRLSMNWVTQALEEAGFRVLSRATGRLTQIIAQKN